MSSLGRVNIKLFKNKFKIISWILGIQILFSLAYQVWKTITSPENITSFTGEIFGAVVIGIVMLSVINERVYINDKFRLIPISDGTLYLGNMLTSVLGLVYLIACEIVIYVVSITVFPNKYDDLMVRSFNSTQQYLFKFEVLVAFILGIVVVWAGITALHLLVNWVNDFLPFRSQNFVKVIVAAVVVWLFMILFNFITGNVLRIMGINDLDNSFAAVSRVMYSSMAMMIIWIAIFTIINLYLLNKKSETVN
jgi:Predicted membrane protein